MFKIRSKMLKVSFVMPAYQKGQFIAKAIDSVRS